MMSLFMSSLCTVTCDSFCSHCSSDSVCLDAWGDHDYQSDGTVGRAPASCKEPCSYSRKDGVILPNRKGSWVAVRLQCGCGGSQNSK